MSVFGSAVKPPATVWGKIKSQSGRMAVKKTEFLKQLKMTSQGLIYIDDMQPYLIALPMLRTSASSELRSPLALLRTLVR